MKDNSKMLLGFMAGVAAGIGVYALTQSEGGKKWVKKAKNSADKWKHKVDDLIHRQKKAAEDLADNVTAN